MTSRHAHRRRTRAGFSLIEVLMAIFILGIGVISIAALFPAGIAQQRQSVDDVMGPIVADNAFAILRSKVSAEDFGTFDAFTPALAGVPLRPPRYTVGGDWSWLRPGMLLADESSSPNMDETGAIDLFSYNSTVLGSTGVRTTEFPSGYTFGAAMTADPPLYGIPYNRSRWGNQPPPVFVTQQERYYPMGAQLGTTTTDDRPQYVWDCMFRRFQGQVLVAIFVYRVNDASGEPQPYVVADNPSGGGTPPLPVWLEIANANDPEPGWDVFGPDLMGGTADDNFVLGTDPCTDYDVFNAAHTWQESGQWLLDQNNTIHRVLSSYCDDTDPGGPRQVELTRSVPGIVQPNVGSLGLPLYWMLPPFDGLENVVSDIWYIPAVDAQDRKLTPVYVTVRGL